MAVRVLEIYSYGRVGREVPWCFAMASAESSGGTCAIGTPPS